MSTTILDEWTGYGLANGEHLDYSKAIAGALHGLDPAKVPVGEQVAALEALNTKYTDFINESRKFVDTADITKADAKRDALFMAIYTAVDHLAAIDGDTPQDLAHKARIVQAVSGAYKGVTRHSLTKETEELRGFGFDMQKNPAAVEAITALGMLPWLNALMAANDELDELYKHRTSERGDREASAGVTAPCGGSPPVGTRTRRSVSEAERDDGERAQGGVHPHRRDRRSGQRGAEAHSVGGAGGRGHGANGRDQPVQTRRLAAHREKGEAGTRPGSRFVSGKRPFRPRKSPLQTAGGLSGLGEGPCILQGGFPALKNTPAICKKVFQPRKMSLQFARGFFNPEKHPCNLHGRFLRPAPPPARKMVKYRWKLRKDVAA